MNPLKGKNLVVITGAVTKQPEFVRETHDTKIYRIEIAVKRKSDVTDILPVELPEKLLDEGLLSVGNKVKVMGYYRSANVTEGEKNHVILYIYAKELSITDEEDSNFIFLNGYLCKEPVYRTTPLGKEICEFILAVNRPIDGADYIPCLTWGAEADKAKKYKVGDNVELHGRIQSRVYAKTENEQRESRIAYEVSAGKSKKIAKPKAIS